VRQAALEELCRWFRYPIYAFLRRGGHLQHDAEDLKPGLFLKLIHEDCFDVTKAHKGRLRTFLLGALDRQARRSGTPRGDGQASSLTRTGGMPVLLWGFAQMRERVEAHVGDEEQRREQRGHDGQLGMKRHV
jgi:hypothetical protein